MTHKYVCSVRSYSVECYHPYRAISELFKSITAGHCPFHQKRNGGKNTTAVSGKVANNKVGIISTDIIHYLNFDTLYKRALTFPTYVFLETTDTGVGLKR